MAKPNSKLSLKTGLEPNQLDSQFKPSSKNSGLFLLCLNSGINPVEKTGLKPARTELACPQFEISYHNFRLRPGLFKLVRRLLPRPGRVPCLATLLPPPARTRMAVTTSQKNITPGSEGVFERSRTRTVLIPKSHYFGWMAGRGTCDGLQRRAIFSVNANANKQSMI